MRGKHIPLSCSGRGRKQFTSLEQTDLNEVTKSQDDEIKELSLTSVSGYLQVSWLLVVLVEPRERFCKSLSQMGKQAQWSCHSTLGHRKVPKARTP